MRYTLPGGAVLSGGERDGVELVACRPLAGVETRAKPRSTAVAEESGGVAIKADRKERLGTMKLVLEVLTLLVGLVGSVLALFGLSRK